MSNPALTVHHDSAEPESALSTLQTVQQKAAFCNYLVASIFEPTELSRFDIDMNLFSNFIKSAEQLSPSARLAFAMSLLGDILMIEQERVQRSVYMRNMLTPTVVSASEVQP